MGPLKSTDARGAMAGSPARPRSGSAAWAKPLTLLAACVVLATAQASYAQMQRAKVRVARVKARSEVAASEVLSLVGTVLPARVSRVGSAVAGRVKEFNFNAGDFVAKGEGLASLQTRQIDIQIAAAKAQHDLSLQELAELENKSRPEEIEQAHARMEAARATLEFSEKKLERTRSLVEQRAVNLEQLQDDASVAERSRQLLREAQAAHKLVVEGPRKEKVAQARARVEIAHEEVLRLEDQLDKHTMRAPFDGYVVAEHTEVGQWISQGELVAEVIEIAEVDVEAPAPEAFVPRLRVRGKSQAGTPAIVRVDALGDAEFPGELTAIVPQADLKSRNFPIKVRLKNATGPDGLPLLKPGMMASVEFSFSGEESAVLVPKDALKIEGRKRTVYVFEPDAGEPMNGRVRETSVVLGAALGGMIEVRGKVQPGELVVVEGNERLRAPWQATLVAPPPDKPDAQNPRQASTAPAQPGKE